MGKAAHTFQSMYQLWTGDEATLVADKLLSGGTFPVF